MSAVKSSIAPSYSPFASFSAPEISRASSWGIARLAHASPARNRIAVAAIIP